MHDGWKNVKDVIHVGRNSRVSLVSVTADVAWHGTRANFTLNPFTFVSFSLFHTSSVHFISSSFSCMFISIHAITEYPKLLSILSSRHHYFHHVTGRFYSSSAAATAIGRKNLKRSVLLPHQPKSGHNLTSRGELLTKAVRRQLKPKDENSNNVNSDGGGEMIEVGSVDSGMTLKMPVAKVFRGMIVPEKPIPPGPDGTFFNSF